MSDNPADGPRRELEAADPLADLRSAVKKRLADECPVLEEMFNAGPGIVLGLPDAATVAAKMIAEFMEAARADERKKIEKLRGDVHHNLNSSIGLMRWKLEGSEFAEYFERVIIPRLYATTDAADAALGERPMREQLADMQRDIALARSAGVEPKEQQT